MTIGELPSEALPTDLTVVDALRAERAAVVVATKNRSELLRCCLNSILRGSLLPDVLIVADSTPVDDAAQRVVEEIKLNSAEDWSDRIVYLASSRPGVAAAHNVALDYAHGCGIVAFTDDDVIVDERWLESVVDGFKLGDNVACVTGLISAFSMETEAARLTEDYHLFSKGSRSFLVDNGSNRDPHPLFPFNAGRFGSGANMAFRTEMLAATGGFDEALGAGTIARGGDDLAAFFEVLASGCQLAYEPAAVVRHRHHETIEGLHAQLNGYATGLSAYLTSVIVRHPAMAFRLLIRFPLAVVALTRVASNQPLSSSRRWGWWLSLLKGPGCYLRARLAIARERTEQ